MRVKLYQRFLFISARENRYKQKGQKAFKADALHICGQAVERFVRIESRVPAKTG